jgi:putative tryptophan/tyrosine transport system substrate-binding protein
MRRRQFIAGLVGAAAWPPAAPAQQPAIPVVGVLSTTSPNVSTTANSLAALVRGLADAGYVEGRNLKIEYRFAEGQYDRLPILAMELVEHRVAVIVTSGAPAASAARTATTTTPIVFMFAGDPVAAGLVASLNRPGGNATGIAFMIAELGAKKLELLRELSHANIIGVLVNPSNAAGESERAEIEAAAHNVGQRIQILNAASDRDFEDVSNALERERPDALLVGSDPFFLARRERIISLAAHHRLPALYSLREFVSDGGLLSYGTSLADAYRQGGMYVGRILGGTKPADLPVVQSAKFELVINLKTAKALGVVVPPDLIVSADEVIE